MIGERPGQPGYYRYSEKPAGNPDTYEDLKSNSDSVYNKLFHKDYVARAIEGDTPDLYTVFSNFMNKDFTFSNSIIASVKGCSGGTISKANDKYRTAVADVIREIKNG